MEEKKKKKQEDKKKKEGAQKKVCRIPSSVPLWLCVTSALLKLSCDHT